MTTLEILLGIAGGGVTMLVLAGMFLLTPRAHSEIPPEGSDPQGSNLSQAPAQAARGPRGR